MGCDEGEPLDVLASRFKFLKTLTIAVILVGVAFAALNVIVTNRASIANVQEQLRTTAPNATEAAALNTTLSLLQNPGAIYGVIALQAAWAGLGVAGIYFEWRTFMKIYLGVEVLIAILQLITALFISAVAWAPFFYDLAIVMSLGRLVQVWGAYRRAQDAVDALVEKAALDARRKEENIGRPDYNKNFPANFAPQLL